MGEVAGFAVGVTVGSAARRGTTAAVRPRAVRVSASRWPTSKRSPSAKRMQQPGVGSADGTGET